MSDPAKPGQLDAQTVAHLAKLSRLSLSEAELAAVGQDLNRVLEYMELLNEADLQGVEVEPSAHLLGKGPALRADAPVKGLDNTLALAAAPDAQGGGFGVPKFVEE